MLLVTDILAMFGHKNIEKKNKENRYAIHTLTERNLCAILTSDKVEDVLRISITLLHCTLKNGYALVGHLDSSVS